MNKSTSFLVVLIAGAALIFLCFFLPETVTATLRKQSMEIFGPVLRTAEKPIGWFGRVDTKLKTLDQAQAEVSRLHLEVARLTVENQLLTDKENENKRLREMLGFQAASKYELLPCRVVSREPSNWWTSVQVNVGWDNNKELDGKYHGKYSLTSDQPVVSPRGIVGKTGNVTKYVTDVILLVDKNCRITATIENSHDQGILIGQGNFEEGKPRVMLDYLPKESQVKANDFIVTSGLGPYFPAGLRLGTVTDVPPLNNNFPTFGLYRQAYIEPTANLNQLDELFIVLGPKQQTDKGEQKSESAPTSAGPSSPDTPVEAPSK